MTRVSYVNGQYVPHRTASIHVEDRGNQFADGVYEVIAVNRGRLIDEVLHFDRLERSLGELRIPMPFERNVLSVICSELIRQNRIKGRGTLYIQVSRGVAPRNHAFPDQVSPGIFVTTRIGGLVLDWAREGVRVILTEDIRWRRCDIKSIALLPNVLAKQKAREEGAYEAWMVDVGSYITEGSASNAWIIDAQGKLRTGPLSDQILGGVTRKALHNIATTDGLEVVERAFTVDEALNAREAFMTSTTNFVLPVTQIDNTLIGDGVPGPVTRRLIDLFEKYIANQ